MRVQILLKTSGEPELMMIMPKGWLDIPEGQILKFLVEVDLSDLEKTEYHGSIHSWFAPSAAPPSEATGGLAVGRSESDEQDFGYEAQMNIETHHERRLRERKMR